jgi:hypothetical protein
VNGGARSDNHHSNADHDHHHEADHHDEDGASSVHGDHVKHHDLDVWAERTIKHPRAKPYRVRSAFVATFYALMQL